VAPLKVILRNTRGFRVGRLGVASTKSLGVFAESHQLTIFISTANTWTIVVIPRESSELGATTRFNIRSLQENRSLGDADYILGAKMQLQKRRKPSQRAAFANHRPTYTVPPVRSARCKPTQKTWQRGPNLTLCLVQRRRSLKIVISALLLLNYSSIPIFPSA
jgi:hypothetical protein